jgi:hypothetical protein
VGEGEVVFVVGERGEEGSGLEMVWRYVSLGD